MSAEAVGYLVGVQPFAFILVVLGAWISRAIVRRALGSRLLPARWLALCYLTGTGFALLPMAWLFSESNVLDWWLASATVVPLGLMGAMASAHRGAKTVEPG